MASDFAKTLSEKLTADVPPHVVEWGQRVIDAELKEVRDLLGEMSMTLHKHLHADLLIPFEQCSHARCQRARALWTKLEIKQ